MKLLYCKNCHDVFNLQAHTKSCGCGKTEGRYTDGEQAEYSGEQAVPFAIDNFSFFARIKGDEQRNDIYDSMHGKDKIQCWLLEQGKPNFETIKKVTKQRHPWRCGH